MKKALIKISKINSGYIFFKKAIPDVHGKYAVVFISDISHSSVLRSRPSTYELPTEPEPPHFLKRGDILVQARGKVRIIYVETDLANTIASSNFLVVRVAEDKILGRYLAWYLAQKPAQQFLERGQQGQTVAMLSKKILSELPVMVPSFERQKQIVKVIETKEHYFDLMQTIQKKYERVFDAIAIKEFGGFFT